MGKKKYLFLFLNQNISFGYLKDTSQWDVSIWAAKMFIFNNG